MNERFANLMSLQGFVFLFAGSMLLFLICLAGFACKSGYPTTPRQGADNKGAARQVKTARVVEMPVGETVTVNGTLAAFDQTTVSVKVPGRMKSILVDLGSVVHRGQVIGQLEPEDYKRSEEHTSELQSRLHLVCRLLLEKKNTTTHRCYTMLASIRMTQ